MSDNQDHQRWLQRKTDGVLKDRRAGTLTLSDATRALVALGIPTSRAWELLEQT